MDGNLSAADIMAMTKNDEGMNGLWNNPFIYLVWIWAFRMFGNGFGGGDAATQGSLTRSDLFEGFNTQSIKDKLDTMSGTLCNSFANVTTGMTNGFNGVMSGLAENRFAQQSCC